MFNIMWMAAQSLYENHKNQLDDMLREPHHYIVIQNYLIVIQTHK